MKFINLFARLFKKMAGKAEDYAGRVFLLMGKDYRISRSIRAQWFFEHINSTVYSKSDQELVSNQTSFDEIILPLGKC